MNCKNIILPISTSIPNDVREIIAKLYFIGMIKTGMKINTMGKLGFVNSESWYGALTRAINHENRKITLNFINNLIDLSIKAINTYNKTEFSHLLIRALSNAKTGILNLANTYNTDLDFYSNIKVCIDNIDMQLRQYQDRMEDKPEEEKLINDEDI